MPDSALVVKPSYYNEFVTKENKIAVYNTRTGKMVRIDIYPDYSRLLDALNMTSCCLPNNEERLLSLYQHDFLIDVNRDEFMEMKKIEEGQVFDKHMNLLILPTEACNFRCSYCYEKFERGAMSAATQNKLIKYVEQNIENYEGMIVSWFGGEPLEALDVIETLSTAFMGICSAHKKVYFAGITTNGYHLTLDVFRKLKRLHVTEYQITLDGLPEDHDRQRMLANGEGTAKMIIENLLSIKNNIHSHTIRIILRTNFTRPMLEHAGDYVNFLRENFCNDKRYGVFWQVVEDYGYLADNSIRENFCTESEYRELIKNYAFSLNNSVFKSTLQPSGTICYALKKNAFVISADGSIKKCTCDLENEDNYFGDIGGTFDEEKHNKWLKREVKDGSSCYYCKKRPICHFRACKKSTYCPPNLLFYREILKNLADDPKFCITL